MLKTIWTGWRRRSDLAVEIAAARSTWSEICAPFSDASNGKSEGRDCAIGKELSGHSCKGHTERKRSGWTGSMEQVSFYHVDESQAVRNTPKDRAIEIIAYFQEAVSDPLASIKWKKHLSDRAQQNVGCLGAREVAIMFNYCKKGNYMDPDLLDVLAQHLLEFPGGIASLTPIEMSMAVQSLGVLSRQRSSETFFPTATRLVKALVDECFTREEDNFIEANEQSIANVVYGLGLLCKNGVVEFDEVKHLVFCLVDKVVMEGRLERYRSQEMTNILYGCALMGAKSRYALKRMCEMVRCRLMANQKRRKEKTTPGGRTSDDLEMNHYKVALKKMRNGHIPDDTNLNMFKPRMLQNDFAAHELATIVWSLAKLDMHLEDFMKVWSKEVADRVYDFTIQNVAGMVYALGLLKYENFELLDTLSYNVLTRAKLETLPDQGLANLLYGFGRLGYPNVEVVGRVMSEVVKSKRLSSLENQHLVQVIYGCGLMGYESEGVVDQVVKRINTPVRLSKFNLQEVSNIVYGMGMAGTHSWVPLENLCKKVREGVSSMKDQEISNVVYGLGLLKDQMERGFVENVLSPFLVEIAPEIKGETRCLSSQSAANICWSFGQLHYLDKDLMDHLVKAFIEACEKQGFTITEEILMVLHGCATLNHKNDVFMEVFMTWLHKHISSLTKLQNIVNVMWGLSVLDRLDKDWFDRLASKLVKLSTKRKGIEMSEGEARQLVQSWLLVEGHKPADQHDQPAEILLMIRRGIAMLDGEMETRQSGLEKDVAQGLGSIRYKPKFHPRIHNGAMRVDMVVAGLSPRVAVEVDGPDHYTINKVVGMHRELGRTVLRNKLIQLSQYKLLCVPYFEWNRMISEERKKWLLKNLKYLNDYEVGIGESH